MLRFSRKGIDGVDACGWFGSFAVSLLSVGEASGCTGGRWMLALGERGSMKTGLVSTVSDFSLTTVSSPEVAWDSLQASGVWGTAFSGVCKTGDVSVGLECKSSESAVRGLEL